MDEANIMDQQAFTELKKQVFARMRGREVILDWECLPPNSPENILVLLDNFVQRIGLNAIEEYWQEVSREEAAQILITTCAQDMAYGTELMDRNTATNLTEQFFGLFDMIARFYTNGNSTSWTPLTEATFEA